MIHYDLATPDDDAAIRQLLVENPVPGQIGLSYEREPSYFAGCAVMGRCQTLVARGPGGVLAGLACRAVRPLWINGQIEQVGYLGQLRVAARFRGQGLTIRGVQALHALHQADPVPGYLAAITAGNRAALHMLVEHPRPGLPTFRQLADLATLALPLRRAAAPPLSEARWASLEDLPAIDAFLAQHGPARQCFPAYRLAEVYGSDTLRDLAIEQVALVQRRGRLAGMLALWDQGRFKQTVVRAYSGVLRLARPLYNALAAARGYRPLPRPGQQLRSVYASLVCVADDDPAVFGELLQLATARASAGGFAYLLLGFAAGDPLLALARRQPHTTYHSQLYTVTWQEGAFHERLDQRLPYLDIAAL